MKQYIQDRAIAVVGLAMVLIGYRITNEFPDDSAIFPKLCLIGIGALLILLIGESEITKREAADRRVEAQKILEMHWGPFVLVACALAAYVLIVDFLGFYASSTLLVLIVGFGWGGVKKSTVLLFATCFVLFLYSTFTLLFNVPLPAGLAF